MIWALGKGSQGGAWVIDALTKQSLLRWGNYDVVSGAVRWCGNSTSPEWYTICNSISEIPTTGIKFINDNPVPASTTLPASFYLLARPLFWPTRWGTPPWPAIGPDVEGGTAPDGVDGRSYAIPAQLCYTNTPVDPSYQKTFTIGGVSWSSREVTLNIGSNTLARYDTVSVSGVAPYGHKTQYEISENTPTTVSYFSPDPGDLISGGTLSYPNILLFNAANCYPAAYRRPVPPSHLRVSTP